MKRWFFFILLAILVKVLFGLAAFIDSKRAFVPTPDSYQYDLLAHNLLESHGFSLSMGPPYTPDSIRTPIYPLFLSLFYLLFGHRTFIIILIQILITSLLSYLIYSLPSLNRREAIIASLFYAFNLNIALHTSQILTESLFMIVIFLGVILFYKFLSTSKTPLLLFSSLLFGVGTLIRPISMFFPLLLGGYLLFYLKKKLKKGIIHLLLFLGVFLSSLSPWLIRNHRIFKGFFLSTIPSTNLLFFDAASTLSAKEGISMEEARSRLAAEFNEVPCSTKGEEVKRTTLLSMKYLLRYPFHTLKIHIVSIADCFFLPLPFRASILYFSGKSLEEIGMRAQVNQEAITLLSQGKVKETISLILKERVSQIAKAATAVFLFASLYHLGLIIGVILSLKRIKREPFYIICGLSIIYFATFAGVAASPRFRTPIEPYLVILSTVGFSHYLPFLKVKNNKP